MYEFTQGINIYDKTQVMFQPCELLATGISAMDILHCLPQYCKLGMTEHIVLAQILAVLCYDKSLSYET